MAGSSAVVVFISKKQKKLIRERRRRKKKKQQHKEEDNPANHHHNGKTVVSEKDNGSNNREGEKKKSVSASAASASGKKRPRPQKQIEDTDERRDKGDGRDVVDSSNVESTSTTKPGPATPNNKNNVVSVPAGLTTKEAKKFRKDARRKARSEGRDETELKFVVEGAGENGDDEEDQRNSKKRRKGSSSSSSFPRINDLVAREKERKREERAKEDRLSAERALTEEYKSRYVALDCEMVGIGADGKKSALARVSATDWDGNVLLDTFVQVPARVTDFRTRVSGVTAADLRPAAATNAGSGGAGGGGAMEVNACRERVADLLRGKVLVGHALKNDLDALMLSHPKRDTRDTAKYRPFQQKRRAAASNGNKNNKWRPRKLRDLARERLNLSIQRPGESHDSVDDARAAMELFKLVRVAWERELERQQK